MIQPPISPEQYRDGANLAIEVIGPEDQQPELVDQRRDEESIGVAVLASDSSAQRCVEHARATIGATAQSLLVPGFAMDVSQLFAAS